MSRKHFVALAAIFAGDLAGCRTEGERNKVRGIVLSTADLGYQSNAFFDRAKFYAASGLTADGMLR